MQFSNPFLGFGDPSSSLSKLGTAANDFNTLFRGGAITDHIRKTPHLAMKMRYADGLKNSQAMQDYLAPLEHFDFVRQATAENPIAGATLGALSAPYNAFKAIPGLDVFAKGAGTGEALTSSASFNDIGESLQGFGQGFADWLKGFKMPSFDLGSWFRW